MKNIFIFLCIVLFFSCQPKQVSETPVIAADTLAMQIDKYAEQEVTVEGKIVHVCPVDGSKMKLTSNRQIIKIIPSAPNGKFERHWNGKRIRVRGKVHEVRLSRAHLDSLYGAGSLLCHIDFSPCSDTAWVAAKHRQGKAAEIVAHYHSFLNMRCSGQARIIYPLLSLKLSKRKKLKLPPK